ncbi:Uncharacterised protein [Mycobacteroides abscessus subsp. abscessus]|nr:Uncharacterised protein [Mycobacteroides abscessus subsp. abscessus]
MGFTPGSECSSMLITADPEDAFRKVESYGVAVVSFFEPRTR